MGPPGIDPLPRGAQLVWEGFFRRQDFRRAGGDRSAVAPPMLRPIADLPGRDFGRQKMQRNPADCRGGGASKKRRTGVGLLQIRTIAPLVIDLMSSPAGGVVHYLQKFGGSTGAINGVFEFMSESFVKTFFPWVYKEATRSRRSSSTEGGARVVFNKSAVNWSKLGLSSTSESDGELISTTGIVNGGKQNKRDALQWNPTKEDRKRGYKVSLVPCLTLAHIFEVLNQRRSCLGTSSISRRLHINLFILDLEGGEMSALRSIDFSSVYFDVLVVETDAEFRPLSYAETVTGFLAEKGYVHVEKIGRNDWFRRIDFVPFATS